jgi:hypothetical protein
MKTQKIPSRMDVRVFLHILKCRCLYYIQEWMNIQDLTEDGKNFKLKFSLIFLIIQKE